MKPLALTVALVLLAGGSCGNVSESRGEPHRGQITNAQWSAAHVDVYTAADSRTRIQPGKSTPKGRTYNRFCIPAGYTGSANIATDDNPAGFPPTRIGGGGCHPLKARDIATVTVNR